MNGHLFKSKKNLYTMDYDGKIIVANFFDVNNPSSYTKSVTELLRIQEKFSKSNMNADDSVRVKIVLFSLNPEADSIPELKKHLMDSHADERMWDYLTGDKKQILTLAQKDFFNPTIFFFDTWHGLIQ